MPSTKSRYRSPLLEAIHSAAEDLYSVGAIDQITMRNFDVECLTPVEPMKPSTIRSLRQKSKMSQATFASALNVTTSLVSQWERGEKKPSGPSLKLLSLVKRKGIDAILASVSTHCCTISVIVIKIFCGWLRCFMVHCLAQSCVVVWSKSFLF